MPRLRRHSRLLASIVAVGLECVVTGHSEAEVCAKCVDVGVFSGFSLSVRSPTKEPVRYGLVRSIGYLPADSFELGLALGIVGNTNGSLGTTLIGRADHYLHSDGRLLPYLGVRGVSETELTNRHLKTSGLYGAQVGTRFFLNADTSFFVEVVSLFPVEQPGQPFLGIDVGISWLRKVSSEKSRTENLPR